MGSIIIPKNYVKEISSPLIFLAGPIRGAPNWQDTAIDIIFSKNMDVTIASPRRGVKASLLLYLLNGDEIHFKRQRAWERHYLALASKTGTIMFWLPGEESHDCSKSYGAMTRLELGQWMIRYSQDKSVSLCIGSDGKFSELDTIKYDLSLDAPDKIIFGSLEETCSEALRLLRK